MMYKCLVLLQTQICLYCYVFTLGNFFNDFYMGRELNPRIGGVDLKQFFIVNVGLLGWATLESFTLVEAFQKDLWTGTLLLVAWFHSSYLLDALLFQVNLCHLLPRAIDLLL